MEIQSFSTIDLSDDFFDSLRDSYDGFDDWFRRKAEDGSVAYVFKNHEGKLLDFLYLKLEEGEVTDTVPHLVAKRRLKVGTFKLKSRGTHRGERFMKKIMDQAIALEVDEIYVTIFPKVDLQYLINQFYVYGFQQRAEKPHGDRQPEIVLVKDMRSTVGNIVRDYPFVKQVGVSKYLLSIYPEYHTKLFPDSILRNESYDLVQDITPTNSIHKIYICWMNGVRLLNHGDLLVIYRTNDGQGPAVFRSVATSVCTVDEVKTYNDFEDENAFVSYSNRYSIFTDHDLRRWYHQRPDFVVIKMLYNVAFTKRVIRKTLLEDVGIPGDAYWGFYNLSDQQFRSIINFGLPNERYFID